MAMRRADIVRDKSVASVVFTQRELTDLLKRVDLLETDC